MRRRYYNQYLATKINSSSNLEIIIMLYDGAIQSMRRCIEAIDQRDIAGSTTMVSRSLDIIVELIDSLDLGVGSKLANNLYNLYLFVTRELMSANLHSDSKKIEDCIKIMEVLRDAWTQIGAEHSADSAQPVENALKACSVPDRSAFFV